MPVDYHLLAPSLFIDPLQGDEYRNLHTPALEALLCRAEVRTIQADNYYQWLSNAFGLDELSVAPLTLQADGHEPGGEYWLRADPVHLRIQRDQIVLFDAHVASLTQEEADALCVTLNQHFITDGLHFIAAKPDRWYLKLSSAPALNTTNLYTVCGKNIHDFMPTGEAAHKWRQRMNEMQMLLFEHPVNVARESRRELPINSVWFWGGGVMPQNTSGDFTQMIADDIFAQSLARAAQIEIQLLPENPQTMLQAIAKPNKENNKNLILINKLHNIMLYGDITKWRDAQEQIDAKWFVPLLASLKSGAINSLTLIDPSNHKPREFVITPGSLRKFWRRAKPLATYV